MIRYIFILLIIFNFISICSINELYNKDGVRIFVEQKKQNDVVEKSKYDELSKKMELLKQNDEEKDELISRLNQENDKFINGYKEISELSLYYDKLAEKNVSENITAKINVVCRKEWYENPLFMLACFVAGGLIF